MKTSVRTGAILAAALALAMAGAACASNGGSAASNGGAAKMIDVSMQEFSISPAQMQAPAGSPIMIMVSNAGQAQHAFAIQAGGKTYTTPMLAAGGTSSLNLPALQPGSYSAWCTVPGHREAGMTAVLLVGQAAAAGGTSTGMDMSHMTAQQMAESHKAGVLAFPAKTAAQGNQVLEPTVAGDVKIFKLVADKVRWEITPGVFKEAYAYNGQVPGPQLHVKQGDKIRIVLENHLPEPTVIHFHGMTVPNGMDGVPYITQDPVMPGGYFTYEFTIEDPPGTYEYHTHFNSAEQMDKGLFGAIIVDPPVKTWDEEYTEIISDGSLGYAINGKGFPATTPLTAKLGDTVRIHVLHAGQLLHPFHLHGYHFQVLEKDGLPLPQPYMADTLVVAPGETYDVSVHATFEGVWAFHCHILAHVEGPQGMFGMVTALVVTK
jgi:FtsP/CotA-like multicopper oxidase with cupredoxin domain